MHCIVTSVHFEACTIKSSSPCVTITEHRLCKYRCCPLWDHYGIEARSWLKCHYVEHDCKQSHINQPNKQTGEVLISQQSYAER